MQFIIRDLPRCYLPQLLFVATLEAFAILGLQPAVGGEDAEPKKGNAGGNRMNACFMGVDFQAQACQKLFNVPSPMVQGGLVCGKEHKIIAVTQISLAAEFLFDELVEFVQVNVGPKLAGLVANGQTARAIGSQQIIIWEPLHLVAFGVDTLPTVDDFTDEAHGRGTGETFAEQVVQYFMIDRGEELHDICLQHVGIAAGKLGAAIQGGMSTFAGAAGVGIMDEAGFPDGFNDMAQGMMHHPIPEGGGADAAGFAIVEVKMAVAAGLILLGAQLFLQGEQFPIQVGFKGGHIGFTPFASPRFAKGGFQGGKVVYLRIEFFECFHSYCGQNAPKNF